MKFEEKVLLLINSGNYNYLANSDEFYFEKAVEQFRTFMKFEIDDNEINELINEFNEIKGFKEYLDQLDNDSIKYKLFNLLGKVIAHIDYHAANKYELNSYNDKRVIAKSMVRQTDWINHLLKYKLSNNLNVFSESTKNAVLYLMNPAERITILSDNQRKAISKSILKTTYNSESFDQEIIEKIGFPKSKIINNDNIGYITSIMLYSDLKNYWQPDEHSNNLQLNNDIKKENLYPKNIILYGPPGTGKTYLHKYLINQLENSKSDSDVFKVIDSLKSVPKGENSFIDELEDRYDFVSFHQSYSYEDFVEGFRPVAPKKVNIKENDSDEGNTSSLNIELRNGIFKKMVDKAKNKKENYYLVIDEINRGNISKIFGELITLIEEDKRLGAKNELKVSLPYSSDKNEIFKDFGVPKNLFIIGTMNTADKSIAQIDVALRRRFTFVRIDPRPDLIEPNPISKEGWKNLDIREEYKSNNDDRSYKWTTDPKDLQEWFINLNIFIESKLGKDYLIGHSYFMKVDSDQELQFVLKYKIIPLMEEYFFNEDKNTIEDIAKYCSIRLIEKELTNQNDDKSPD